MRSRAHTLFIAVLFLVLSERAIGQTRKMVTTVTVRDSPTCSCYLNITTNSVTPATSCRQADGAISIAVQGGSGTYTYHWTNQGGETVGNAAQVNGLLPGYYHITVEDKLRPTCKGQRYLSVGSDLTIGLIGVPNDACILPTGALSAVVTGGSGSFEYVWQLPDGSTLPQKSLSGIPAGQYTVTVTDTETQCSISKTHTIKNSAGLSVSLLTQVPNTSCSTPNGAVAVSVSGGSGEYKYYWYSIAGRRYVSYDKNLSDQPGGAYSLYVIDQISGCTAYQSYTITEQVSLPIPNIVTMANTQCAPPYNGALQTSFADGADAYTVTWKNEQGLTYQGLHPQALAPGSYGYVVTDTRSGCSLQVPASSSEAAVIPDLALTTTGLQIDTVMDNTDCASPNGAIQVTVRNDDHAYHCSWTGPNEFTATTEDLANLSGGTYQLTVTLACAPNQPPVITRTTIAAAASTTVSVPLLSFISDPDSNLNQQSIAIVNAPHSKARWTLDEGKTLLIDYSGKNFIGRDYIQLRACDDLGACAEETIYIEVQGEGIIVYNAVAPNSSGNNKYMRITNLPAVSNRVSIYNRWGDKVFDVTDYDNDVPHKRFTGLTSFGRDLPSGTYFYKIEFADHSKPISGYLVLKQ